MRKILFTLLFSGLLFSVTEAQTTFGMVYNVLQTNCTNATCHNGAQPTIDFSQGASAVYADLIGTSPLNPAAAGKGNKLVDPGHPYNSFLLRKVGADFDSYFDLELAEGNRMPTSGAPALPDNEIELIRQWILTGASYFNNDVDTSLINRYYDIGGLDFITPPPAPHPDSGFQIRLGPIFLEEGQPGNTDEIEYLKKEHFNLDADVEVTRLEGHMNSQSHHFLLFMFDDSTGAAQEDDGLRLVNIFNTATDGDKELQAAWQYNRPYDLPDNTAFYYDQNDWLDLNYHIKNYAYDSIMPADFYLNVYTQPRGSGADEMRAELVNNGNLFLWPGTQSETYNHGWGGPARKIWMISSHTHKYGEDFDIYKRNSNGSRGEQIYEGFFDSEYNFNQGYYDWEHPAVRIFDTLYYVGSDEGLILDTEWYINQGTPVLFGLTTDDEMQLATYLYVEQDTSVNIQKPLGEIPGMAVWPNPAQNRLSVGFDLETGGVAEVFLTDIVGRTVLTQTPGFLNAGHHQVNFHWQDLQPGVYFVRVHANGKTGVSKVIID